MKSLDETRAFLEARYHEIYSEFSDLSEDYSAGIPSWSWVDEDLSPVEQKSSNAMLMDPDVGVVLILLHFDGNKDEYPGTDIRAQVARAIGYRSRLLPKRIPEDNADLNGSWRVIVYWMVEHHDVRDWQKQASGLRRETAHLEELPVDAVIRNPSEDWSAAVRRHGLPRLLLRTRKVLGMTSPDQVYKWSSADERVREALSGFVEEFSNDLEVGLAQKIEAKLSLERSSKNQEDNHTLEKPQHFHSFRVKDFRNLKNIELYFKQGTAQSAVIHGPNGTGKSNLFEAIEFALRGISKRAQDFLRDADVVTTKKPKEYYERYLMPIGLDKSETNISLNGIDVPLIIEQSFSPELKGNMLFQDRVDDFVDLTASDLATEILGEFSGLADSLRSFAESELEQAQGNLKVMLDRLGLDRPGSITKQDTARIKVAERQLREVSASPSHLLAMLTNEAWEWSAKTSQASRLAAALLPDNEKIREFAKKLVKTLSPVEESSDHIREFLSSIWGARSEADQFLKFVSRINAEWPLELANKIDVWGRWLEGSRGEKPVADNQDIAEKQRQRKEFADELELLTKQGLLYREREHHFESLQHFLQGPWKETGTQRCPTCDTDFEDRGGIHKAVDAARNINSRSLEDMRKQYRDIQSQIKILDSELRTSDIARCPLTDEEQSDVRQALLPYLPEGVGFEEILIQPDERNRCIEWVKQVGNVPTNSQFSHGVENEEEIDSLISSLRDAYRDMERGFQLPTAWKNITVELKKRLADVVEQHLPDTLSGLWKELVMNLTPAPWQMQGDLDMHVESRRGRQEARLILGGEEKNRLARYVLNKAETHALGVAWFLVQYLSYGRFRHSILAMDDPALDMDQTTFRDLCRLLESLLRLHKMQSIPLTLMVFLHQDERALNAVRATGGVLYRLGWNTGQAELERSIKLFGDEYRHPQPNLLLQREQIN
ncbi:MAG: AAA family ATPase [Candidatus Thiodiazotropha sp. (ex Monitilora ramsayi)]|nr:AAA family ATPase [Candidatus Thiodiazotropha sp. (ex Monitilora ramsayi)]